MQREVLWGSKARWPCPGTAPHRGASPGTLFQQWRVPVGLRPPAPFSISATDNDSRGGTDGLRPPVPLAMWLHAIGLPRAFAGSAGLRPSTPTKALAAAANDLSLCDVRERGAVGLGHLRPPPLRPCTPDDKTPVLAVKPPCNGSCAGGLTAPRGCFLGMGVQGSKASGDSGVRARSVFMLRASASGGWGLGRRPNLSPKQSRSLRQIGKARSQDNAYPK